MPEDSNAQSTVKMIAHYDTSHSTQSPVHGIFGGIAPQGHIAASFYVERWAIPQRVEIEMTVDANSRVTSQAETPTDGKDGLVRIVTGTYFMTADMAESIATWLTEKVAQLRAADGQ